MYAAECHSENYSTTSPTDDVIADIDKAISEIMQQWKVVAGEVASGPNTLCRPSTL